MHIMTHPTTRSHAVNRKKGSAYTGAVIMSDATYLFMGSICVHKVFIEILKGF